MWAKRRRGWVERASEWCDGVRRVAGGCGWIVAETSSIGVLRSKTSRAMTWDESQGECLRDNWRFSFGRRGSGWCNIYGEWLVPKCDYNRCTARLIPRRETICSGGRLYVIGGGRLLSVLSRWRDLQKPGSIEVLSALLGRGADRRWGFGASYR